MQEEPFAPSEQRLETLGFETIIAGLSKNGWAIVNNIFPDELLSHLSEELRSLDKKNMLEKAGIGRGKDYTKTEAIRKDKIHWLNGDTLAQRIFLEEIERLRLEINRHLMLGLFDYEALYAIYEPGAFYKRHLDSFKGEKNRIISTVLYLNENWLEEDGGLLKLYKNAKAKKAFASIEPRMGTFAVFLSEEIPHEVTTAKNKRLSIAGWLRCNQTL